MADSNSANAKVNAKMGLAGWLTLLFVVLKLNPGGHLDSQVTDWSWWLVFSPVLAGLALLGLVLALAGVFYGLAALLDWNQNRKNKKHKKATQNMTPEERREYYRSLRK